MTPKQQRFVEEYVLHLDGTKAAIAAGYAPNSAHVQASRLLSDDKIRAAIVDTKARRSERTGIDAAWLLTRLADEAEADLSDLYDDAGALRPVKDWPPIWRKGLVGGIKAVEERDDKGNVVGIIREVKLSDRVKRLELIGKHIDVAAFEERVKHSGGVAIVVSAEDAGA